MIERAGGVFGWRLMTTFCCASDPIGNTSLLARLWADKTKTVASIIDVDASASDLVWSISISTNEPVNSIGSVSRSDEIVNVASTTSPLREARIECVDHSLTIPSVSMDVKPERVESTASITLLETDKLPSRDEDSNRTSKYSTEAASTELIEALRKIV